MKKILITLVCVTLASIAFSQSKKYELKAEGNALMCPFMGPRLKKQLELNGAQNILKDKSLVLSFDMPKENALDETTVLDIVKKVGYNPALFHLKIKENE